MNKYQEVKETLEKYDYSTKLELSEGIRNNITSDITVEQFFVMKETCIELLDKATPKGATFTSVGDWRDGSEGFVVECPECKFDFERRTKYCSNCGQKLDWT